MIKKKNPSKLRLRIVELTDQIMYAESRIAKLAIKILHAKDKIEKIRKELDN